MTIPGEKIFSLFESASVLPNRDDLKSQWSEFFCYLFVALLYQEGADPRNTRPLSLLGDRNFSLGDNVYHSEIGRVLAKGLSERFYLLFNNSNTSDKEKNLLEILNKVFQPTGIVHSGLKGSDFLAVCQNRELDMPFVGVAEYLSVMIGQQDFYHCGSVPTISLSLFGNIYLCTQEKINLSPPEFTYNQVLKNGDRVTGLWPLLSAMAPTLAAGDYPGDRLAEVVTGYCFLTQSTTSQFIPLPRFAASLFTQSLLGLSHYNPVYVSALFYKQFLYGSIQAKTVSRNRLLDVIFNQFIKMGIVDESQYLFAPESYYSRLSAEGVVSSSRKALTTPVFLQMAVEALDADAPDLDSAADDTVTADPQTAPGGYDPAAAPPVADEDSENSMDLVSFNKVGEGINEDLYRSAVVALNDQLQADSSSPVSPDVKQALNQWVNGWIYRAAISATKDTIATLKLTPYLKTVSHIPTK